MKLSFEKARELVLKTYMEWNYDRAVKAVQDLNHSGLIPLEDRTTLMEMLIALENGRTKYGRSQMRKYRKKLK